MALSEKSRVDYTKKYVDGEIQVEVKNVQIVDKKLNDIVPYENNPRKNDKSVDYVANSIKEFGFKVPIVIDSDGVIVAGHTRYKAAVKLKMNTVPCIVADDLTKEQTKALRLADNKVGESSAWDLDLLSKELDGILEFDMSDFGFFDMDMPEDDLALDLDDSKPKPEKEMQVCHCPKCGFEFQI